MYYVYILEREVDGTFYKGISQDYLKRLLQHNSGESLFTKNKMPWKIIFVQVFETKKEALIQERKLKRGNKEYLRWLINQPVNILK
ncbi:GIY-YIG nuclease family protein [soil metagenome]